MPTSECEKLGKIAEERANEGLNEVAASHFTSAAICYERWESFANAAKCYERAYEHAMLSHQYAEGAELILAAGAAWIKQGKHERFEINYQIASDAYIIAAEEETDPHHLVSGAFCSTS